MGNKGMLGPHSSRNHRNWEKPKIQKPTTTSNLETTRLLELKVVLLLNKSSATPTPLIVMLILFNNFIMVYSIKLVSFLLPLS